MRFIGRALATGLAAALLAAAPAAAANNAVKSCYQLFPVGLMPAAPARETFVFVDQTTTFDAALKGELAEALTTLITPGSAFTVASFSEAAPGKFPVIINSGTIERGVPPQQQSNISVPQLKKLNACLGQQSVFATGLAVSSIQTALAGAHGSFAHSEILSSLKQLSARVAASPARDRVVLVMSDMLEHSKTTSFFKDKVARPIEPGTELKLAKRAGLAGDFGGARVYVIGGGTGPTKNPSTLAELADFWTRWFKASHATVREFGAPNLLRPVPANP